MHTAHPTLLIGPSDWLPERMPKAEFLRRIEALWQSAPAAAVAIVFGSPAHHAELAYFTNALPKLEPVVALLSRTGAHRLFVGGGANMLGAARPLSWIADMAPLSGLGAALKPLAGSPALLIGGGAMTSALHRTVTGALGASPQDGTAQTWALTRRKSPPEIEAIRAACAMLSVATDAMFHAQRSDAAVTDVVLAGERAANRAGAQDVRTLFGVKGGRTLQPFTTPIREACDPLQVYVAARAFGYWAEGFAPLAVRPHPLADRASALLRTALDMIQPGTRAADVAQMIAASTAPDGAHPVTPGLASRMGLALEEAPHTDVRDVFLADEVYSLKVGLTDPAPAQAVIVSAIIAIRDNGSELLWQTPTTPAARPIGGN